MLFVYLLVSSVRRQFFVDCFFCYKVQYGWTNFPSSNVACKGGGKIHFLREAFLGPFHSYRDNKREGGGLPTSFYPCVFPFVRSLCLSLRKEGREEGRHLTETGGGGGGGGEPGSCAGPSTHPLGTTRWKRGGGQRNGEEDLNGASYESGRGKETSFVATRPPTGIDHPEKIKEAS